MVTSTWRAPAWMAASVLAVASPRSLWQWTLTDRAATDALHDLARELAELGGDGVADGVGDVHGRGAGVDDRLVDAQQEVVVGAARVLGAELDLGVAAQRLARVADPVDGGREGLLAAHPQLVVEVDVGGRDEQVQVRPLGGAGGPRRRAAGRRRGSARARRPRRPSSPAAMRWTASKSPGEAAGKPASMTSTLSRASWRATSSFSLTVSAGAGRLLPVAQGRVEDAYGYVGRSSGASARRCAGQLRSRPAPPVPRPVPGRR